MEEYFTKHTGCAIAVMILIFILCPLTIPLAIIMFWYYLFRNDRIKRQLAQQENDQEADEVNEESDLNMK